MIRLTAALLLAAGASSVATADLAPPPPPKGKKYVSVNHDVVLAKGVTGYTLVLQEGGFGPDGLKYTQSKLSPTAGKAMPMPTPGRRNFVALFAVPDGAVKEAKKLADLFDGKGQSTAKGAHRIGFASSATVSDKVKGDSVKWTHTITAIDAKGITVKVEGEGYEPPKKDGKNSPPGEEEDDGAASEPSPTAAPRGGKVVAGLAAALAVTLGGLWLAGRSRRKA